MFDAGQPIIFPDSFWGREAYTRMSTAGLLKGISAPELNQGNPWTVYGEDQEDGTILATLVDELKTQ